MPSQFRVALSVTRGNAREFELWRNGLRPLFAMDALDAASRSSFAIEATSYQFSDVAVVSGRSSAALFQRGPLMIARGGLDHICVLIYTQGGCSLDLEGRSAEVHAGDACFLDLSRPVTLRAPDYASLTLILPRATLQAYVADLDALHGRILRKSHPLNAMLVSHLQMLFAQAPTLNAADGAVAAKGAAALVAAFVGASEDGRDLIARSKPAATLPTFRQHIEKHLGDLDLGPDSLCQRFGVSRATLFRAFEPMGGVRRYILQRRLARARRLIVDPADAHRRVGSIALQCGFGNTSVFSRAFQSAFGLSPTELRAAQASGELSEAAFSGDQGFASMGRWLLGLDSSGP
ncbi:AraC family transcriptional regulator [Phenylobacterium sp.]|uniref:AraC family transcriptional regulator n=1 Tax=Phenylobacterium sp. TaxID=1871053 RepID=UPI00120DFB0F|nr:AraC family transcriptional regulator [Phenylobacterium sp.]THD58088.1 MAG: AraC family transcriptional regulator [Phenylobacterium sp.]